jgi:hypothetical protein
MSSITHRVWFAVDCGADQSPPLARLRQVMGESGDAYFYRATAFCKLYRGTGFLGECWPDVAAFVRWPKDWQDMRDTFTACGICAGSASELYGWHETNGWLIQKAIKERARSAQNRRAAKLGARKRRAQAQAKGAKGGRLVGR